MTPDLSAALEPLGWYKTPFKARFVWSLTLQPGAGQVAENPQAAKAALRQHSRLCRAVVQALADLRALTDDARGSINLSSTPVADRDSGLPDHVGHTIGALEALSPGLLVWDDWLTHEAGKARRGGRLNEPAYRVASVLAEVHTLGLGSVEYQDSHVA